CSERQNRDNGERHARAVRVGRPARALLDASGRRESARDARAPAVADLALAAARGPRQAAFLLTTVDDDRYVGVVLVVVGELGIELVRQGLRYDAIDHDRDPSP